MHLKCYKALFCMPRLIFLPFYTVFMITKGASLHSLCSPTPIVEIDDSIGQADGIMLTNKEDC